MLLPALAMTMLPAILVSGLLAVVVSVEKRTILERLSAAIRRNQLSRAEADVARETERQRIAGDFHDGPLQSFISFQMRLEIIRKLLTRDANAAMQEVVQLQDLGRAQVTELRSFVRNMQPADVNSSNLGGAIRETVEHFERDSGITATLKCGDMSMVEEDIAGELFQIVRESLNNVRKHSKASQVKIEFEAHRDEIGLTVDDDGSGFPFSGTFNLDELESLRLGPRSIKRRVRTLVGEMAIESRPRQGCSLRIKVPNR
ncbi:MAG: histidine kinase [Bryobacteraceae bacterium]